MLCGDLNGKESQKRGDICIHIADSLHCTAETQHCKVTIPQLKINILLMQGTTITNSFPLCQPTCVRKITLRTRFNSSFPVEHTKRPFVHFLVLFSFFIKTAKYLCNLFFSSKSSMGIVASGQHPSLPHLCVSSALCDFVPIYLLSFAYWKKVDSWHPLQYIKSTSHSLAAH